MKSFIYIGFTVLLLFSCDRKQARTAHHEGIVYTCPMHPSVISDKPGTCPICGMDLVKKTVTNDNTIMLNESQKKLANISTQRVSIKPIGSTMEVNGRLAADEERTEVISSRVVGRIERLYIKETGRFAQQGEPLYELYSEPLLTMQREFLLAREQYNELGKTQPRYESLLTAARKKLLLYGMTKKQVELLADSKSAKQTITFFAPVSGIVTELNATEGQYVNEGTLLYRIEDITQLWVEAELYPNELALVKIGEKMNVRVSGFESSPEVAGVTFINPEYKPGTQITLVRASLPNPQMKFKPGMQAQVLLTQAVHRGIAIPIDAVIRGGKGSHVYVQTDSLSFQPRMVQTGIEDFEQVEIRAGLEESETIVVSGAYLLYSELVLKKGVNPMDGHQHGAMDGTPDLGAGDINSVNVKPDVFEVGDAFARQVGSLLDPYIRLKDAFVSSDAQAAAIKIKEFIGTLNSVDMNELNGDAHVKWMEELKKMETASKLIQTSSDLEIQRAGFAQLSDALYSTIKSFGIVNLSAYYQFCPMAFDNKGAYWLSKDKEISNPYFGKRMLRCGITRETLK